MTRDKVDPTLGRRRLLGVAGGSVLGSLAGCLGVTEDSSNGKAEWISWVPKNNLDAQTAYYFNLANNNSLSNTILRNSDVLGILDVLNISKENALYATLYAGGGNIIIVGNFDADTPINAIADTAEETEPYEDYQVFENRSSTLAIKQGTVIVSTDAQIEPSLNNNVERIIDTKNDQSERFGQADSISQILQRLGGATIQLVGSTAYQIYYPAAMPTEQVKRIGATYSAGGGDRVNYSLVLLYDSVAAAEVVAEDPTLQEELEATSANQGSEITNIQHDGDFLTLEYKLTNQFLVESGRLF